MPPTDSSNTPRSRRILAPLWVTTCLVSAHIGAQDRATRDALLGKGLDLATVTKSIDSGTARSLTAQAPRWMRALFRELVTKQTGLLELIPGLLGDKGSSFEKLGEVLAAKAIDRIAELEGTWQEKGDGGLSDLDLALLEQTYSMLKFLTVPMRLLESSTPWRRVLGMSMSPKYGLTEARFAELCNYLEKLPQRAQALHSLVASKILRRSKNDKHIATVLRSLSTTYETNGRPNPALGVLRESMRRKTKIKPYEWVHLGRLYAMSGYPGWARRAVGAAREALKATETDPAGRSSVEIGIADVESLAVLATKAKKLEPPKTTEDKILLLALYRQLSRPNDAAAIGLQLDKASVRDARVYANLGLLYMSGGRGDLARRCVLAAEKLPNRDETFHELRVWVTLRTILIEGLLLFRGAGDIERTFQTLNTIEEDLGILAEKHGRTEFATPHTILRVLREFTPAIRDRDPKLAIEILRRHQQSLVELRTAEGLVPGAKRLALWGIAIAQDPATILEVLSNPTRSERKESDLISMRGVLAIALINVTRTPRSLKAAKTAIDDLPPGRDRHLFCGTYHAIRAHSEQDAALWAAAIEEFRAGSKLEKLSPADKSCFLNNLGVSLFFAGELGEAREIFATAAKAQPEDNAIALNSVTCASREIDWDALVSLAEHAPSQALQRWLIHRALAQGDRDLARTLAREALKKREPIHWTEHPLVRNVATFEWGVGLKSKTGPRIRATISITPRLARPAPITKAQVDDLAK